MTKQYLFPERAEAILDVTKAPYFADPTGQTDSTEAICRAIDDVMSAYERAFYETKEKLYAHEEPDALISFEIRKVGQKHNVIFPEVLPPSRIIYFPNGTYLVSDTLTYHKEEFRNICMDERHMEMNGQLRMVGQSKEGVTIRLKDNCPGFEYGNSRAVVSFLRGECSNIAMTNAFENITIDIGAGNPGAVGLVFFANNAGGVRNVCIRSSDPDYRGHIGFAILHEKISAGMAQNVEVVGFDYGFLIKPTCHFTTFEHIRCSHQRRYGFMVEQTMVSLYDFYSENTVPAIRAMGINSVVCVVNATCRGGSEIYPAVKQDSGTIMLRNVWAHGYGNVLGSYLGTIGMDQNPIREYVSPVGGPYTLFPDTLPQSLALPVENPPEYEWEAPEKWVCVKDFGAVGDGEHDDSPAIQAAMNSGARTVYFDSGVYLMDSPVIIPETVEHVHCMYCSLASGPNLREMREGAAFVVKGETEKPLHFQALFAWEKFYGYMRLLEHASKRTLVMRNVHIQTAGLYFNTVEGGKVFLDDTCCTIGGIPGAGARTKPLPFEENLKYSRQTPCYHFKNQQVWCRQLNPERSLREVVNDGGLLWVLGFKTEEEGTGFETLNGGQTEVLGGAFVIGMNKEVPLVKNVDSDVSVFASTYIYGPFGSFPLVVEETRGEETKQLRNTDLPKRSLWLFNLPLYVGRSKKK